MKSIFKTLVLVAAAAMALTSCENEAMDSIQEGQNETFTLSFVADAPEGTRTSVSIDGSNASFAWSVDEEGNLTDRVVFLQTQNANTKVNTKYSDKTQSSIANGKATFVTEFTDVEGATTFNYSAIYPAQSVSGTTINAVGVEIPASQALTAGSYDPAADLMMSKVIADVATKDGHGGVLEFTRLAAIGRMTIKGITSNETIQSVSLTFTDKVLNGDVTLNFEEGTATYATEGGNCVELSGSMVATGEDVVYFTCFPGEYSGAYTVEVVTDAAKYTKTGTIEAEKALSFTAGNVMGFTVAEFDSKAVASSAWTLVTDASTLAVGDQIVIGAAKSNVVMSTTQNGNNRGMTSNTTVDGNTLSFSSEDVQIFTLQAGTITGTWAFYTGSGYIYAASSSKNYLRTQTTNDDNGSWTISITDGVATVTAQGSNTRNWLRYNNGNSIFSCYGSGQQDICLYRLEGGAGEGGGETPGEGEGDEPVELDGTGEGTEASPYDVTRALSVIKNGVYTSNNVYTKGIISSIKSVDTGSYGNAEYSISVDGTTDEELIVYRGYYLNGAKFTSVDQIQTGDEVVVCGVLTNYDGTYEYTSGSKITSLKRTKLVMSNITCTNEGENEDTLTFTWSAVENALGYEVTFDGVVVESNTTETTYTANGLTAGKTYTISVKAIGDGTNYTTSDAKSCSATTKTAAGVVSISESMNIYANKGSLSNKVITWEGTNLTVSNAQGNSTNAIRTSDSDHYRAYQGSTLTIAATNGYKLSKVAITCTGASYATAIVNSMANAANGITASTSNNVVTLVCSNAVESITGTMTAQSRFKKVEVTLTK